MTQKELLYFEDAIGHEKNIISILSETIKMITDSDIKVFLEDEINNHDIILKSLISVLEGVSNE